MGLNLDREAEKLLSSLKNRKEFVGFVESCTGGLLSSSFVKLPGVSDVYKGSIVSYSNESKAQLVGVNPKTLESDGAVSEAVAKQMAQGGKVALNVDWCVSITGIAGPTGGTSDKPIGTVWFAAVGPNFDKTFRANFIGTRHEVQLQSAHKAYQILLEGLGA